MHNLEKAVYIDVSTFDSLKEKSHTIVDVSENILKNFFLHYNYPIRISVETFDFQTKYYTYNSKSWIKILSMIQKEEIRHLLINTVRNTDSVQPELAFSITFDYTFNDELYENMIIANNIAFSLNKRLFNQEIPKKQQKIITELFIEIFKKINGVVGFINIDFPHASISPNSTPFEEKLGRSFIQHSETFRKNTRGFFWGNILSEKHIEKLGGINTIREKAPCYHIQNFDFGDGRNAVYLQLTEDINQYTEDDLNKLKCFLKPVLPLENSNHINIMHQSFG